MGKDNQPKHRQESRDLKRRAARRAPYERLLIVCEGEKTEPHYLKEIQSEKRLSTANVQVWPSELGTQPLQVVEYAETLFLNGCRAKAIEPLTFDRILAVFDRDDHATYYQALDKVRALNGNLINDDGEPIPVQAIASVPCFELWLLLHFENIQAPIHRNEVYQRLQSHLNGYQKGQGGHWESTRHNLDIATQRAHIRAQLTNAYNGLEPFTNMHELVHRLLHLKD